MVRTILASDLTWLLPRAGNLPAMTTLTLPGDWLTVAPSASAWKRLIRMWRRRFEAAWGFPLRAVWKSEFQRRGAPHLHLLSVVPTGIAYGHLVRQSLESHPGGRSALTAGSPQASQDQQQPTATPEQDPTAPEGPGSALAPLSEPDATPGRLEWLPPRPGAFDLTAWRVEPNREDVLEHFMTAPGLVGRPIPAGAGESFQRWLGASWADVVDHPDPQQRELHERAGTDVSVTEGMRATDPRRIAVYFTKHSAPGQTSKEYQHVPPPEWGDRVGRFWGSWGVDLATATVEIPAQDAIDAARIARRHARAQGTTRAVSVWRTGEGRFRTVRRRVRRMRGSSGFVAVNDGPAFAWQLARALDQKGPANARTPYPNPAPAAAPEPDRTRDLRSPAAGGFVARHARRAAEALEDRS